MELHFAPMQGYADRLYRRFHAEVYGAADEYYTPFIRVEKGEPRRQDMARLRAALDDGAEVTPQAIFSSAEEFGILTEAVKSLGFRRIDLNLGCPYPMQTRRGRGAAMIARLDEMERVAAMIEADPGTAYSVKMRLGLDDPREWRQLMPILNSLKLRHITIHPRVASQMYGGELRAGEAAELLADSANPVIINGDILTIADIERARDAYPGIKGVMIGRGMLGRPSLMAEWRQGQEWDRPARMRSLLDFHDRLYDAYRSTLQGDTQILQHIKCFWEYLEPEIGRKAYKAIRKAGSVARYEAAVNAMALGC